MGLAVPEELGGCEVRTSGLFGGTLPAGLVADALEVDADEF